MKKKLNVAILIDVWLPFMGGAQRQVQAVTKIWQQERALEFKVFHSLTPHFLTRVLWLFYVIPQVCYRHFLEKRFDLIHAHAFLAGLPAKFLSVILGIPVVFTIHGTGVEVWEAMRPGILGRIKKEMEELILFKIKYTAQISVSSDILKMPDINQNIFIIPNGVNADRFDKFKVKKASGFKILFVGRLHPQKGLIYLIKAIKEVIRHHPETFLYLIGEGPQENFLKSQVKNLNLEKEIKFRGRIIGQALIKEYKSSHLFVLPSLYEGQPLTILEAWAAGLPVVVTAVGENPLMIKEGVNGYLVKIKDFRALAKAITKARENPRLFSLGKNGYHLVKKKFSWLKIAQQTLRVYQKVLD